MNEYTILRLYLFGLFDPVLHMNAYCIHMNDKLNYLINS